MGGKEDAPRTTLGPEPLPGLRPLRFPCWRKGKSTNKFQMRICTSSLSKRVKQNMPRVLVITHYAL